jgi:hypothetical protein
MARLEAGDGTAFEQLAKALTSPDNEARRQAEAFYKQLFEHKPDVGVRYLCCGLSDAKPDMKHFCCVYLRKVRPDQIQQIPSHGVNGRSPCCLLLSSRGWWHSHCSALSVCSRAREVTTCGPGPANARGPDAVLRFNPIDCRCTCFVVRCGSLAQQEPVTSDAAGAIEAILHGQSPCAGSSSDRSLGRLL